MLKIFALLYFIPAMVKIQGEECDFHKMIGGGWRCCAGANAIARDRSNDAYGRLWEIVGVLGGFGSRDAWSCAVCNLSSRVAPTAREGRAARNLTLSQILPRLLKTPTPKRQSASRTVCNHHCCQRVPCLPVHSSVLLRNHPYFSVLK